MHMAPEDYVNKVKAQREAERLAEISRALTVSRDIAGALYEEALGIGIDHGSRSEGAVAAILATLTAVYLKEVKV